MARAVYQEESTHCVSCGELVPEARLDRGAITCSDECSKKRRVTVRTREDRKKCRYCRKPSTPEQRRAFKRFAKLEIEAPHLLYPQEFKAWFENSRYFKEGFNVMSMQDIEPEFAEHWRQRVANEDTDLRSFNEGRPAKAKEGDGDAE
jgi:hypothetical protein